ncbi:hypothetical protein B0H10DRAFT_1838225, partial [Mycena sp. CBHHK59/15]
TRTIPQRTVYTAIQADVRALMGQVQTQEQLDALRARLADEAMNDRIFDPPVVNHKGRPQTQRLTGPTEGRPRGGGARIQGPDPSQNVARRQNRCSKCHLVGHNRTSCPTTTR